MKTAKFEKVSYAQYAQAMNKFDSTLTDEDIKAIYEAIQLPKRATKGSAGYDFFAPVAIHLEPGQTINIPTGIRVQMNERWVLMLYPRSGLGFKYRMQLNNTVGIIDSDYYFSDNEGHIYCKITNDTNENKVIDIPQGSGMIQGIFMTYGITEDDETIAQRNGGFGSTDQ